MKISAKSRYGLASIVYISQHYASGEYITVLSISEKLGISKIYLEQVFSLLKHADLVYSVKGSQGGYQLARPPEEISAYEVLKAIETGLFEKTQPGVEEENHPIEKALQSLIWRNLDQTVISCLSEITLQDLVQETRKYDDPDHLMFYI